MTLQVFVKIDLGKVIALNVKDFAVVSVAQKLIVAVLVQVLAQIIVETEQLLRLNVHLKML